MAIGAHMSDILTQFLVEAVALTLLGGIAGAAAGVGAISLMQVLLGWPMKLSSAALEISIGVSALTGTVFDFFPALRAARLDPIEALRLVREEGRKGQGGKEQRRRERQFSRSSPPVNPLSCGLAAVPGGVLEGSVRRSPHARLGAVLR